MESEKCVKDFEFVIAINQDKSKLPDAYYISEDYISRDFIRIIVNHKYEGVRIGQYISPISKVV